MQKMTIRSENYREAERKSYVNQIAKKTEEAWQMEAITDKGYNKIMNILNYIV